MTVKSSPNWSLRLRPSNKKSCQNCGLFLNQPPVIQRARKSEIFWVGLSAVRISREGDKMPLSPDTNSGALISTIEEPLKHKISFYKTNLVKCLPLANNKIRYPNKCEMECCHTNFEREIKNIQPKKVFLLGKQVATFIFKKYNLGEVKFSNSFDYQGVKLGNTIYVPVHHPSYILVYKRKKVKSYISAIQRHCTNLNYGYII